MQTKKVRKKTKNQPKKKARRNEWEQDENDIHLNKK